VLDSLAEDRLVGGVIYLAGMSGNADTCTCATVFNEVADEYDRHRPTYPDVLIDRACKVAGIEPGAPVLEVGCGTGQLTRSVVARGLRVTAVEPGLQLITRAREHLADAGEVQFVNARLEEAALPRAHFQAVFSAAAIHWIDPDVSWHRAADALIDGGTLALISYFGLEEPRSAADQRGLRNGMARIAPELAAAWPRYRTLDATLAGAAARRGNVSEVWAWLGSYEVGRSHAARLFSEVAVATVPTLHEHTGQELNALLGTMSFWTRLSPRQHHALAAENHALRQRLGRPIRSSTIACLVTARRTSRT
jgi:SAM-dependent methyltransferase